MDNIKVISIVIPTYNRSFLLEKCIDSIVGQQLVDNKILLEIIICDGNSTDDTESMIQQYIAQNQKSHIMIKYLKSNTNMGPGENRNRGAKEASGEIIGFIDDDSYYDLDSISHVLKQFQKSDADIIRCKVKVLEKERISPFSHQPSVYDFREHDYGGIFFIRKEAFKKIGGFSEVFFDSKKKIHFREDTDFFLKSFDLGIKNIFLDSAIVYHPVFKGSWFKPFRDAIRSQYEMPFRKKWTKYVKMPIFGRRVCNIPLTMFHLRLLIGIVQMLFFIASLIDSVFWVPFFIFLVLHVATFWFHNKRNFRFIYFLVLLIECFILPYFYIWYYVKGLIASWKLHV